MVKLEINKEYLLKLGEAEPINSVYLGIKRYKGGIYKHIFVVCNFAYRSTFTEYRFALGELDKTFLIGDLFNQGTVKIKEPIFKSMNKNQEHFLSPLITKLENQ